MIDLLIYTQTKMDKRETVQGNRLCFCFSYLSLCLFVNNKCNVKFLHDKTKNKLQQQ